MRLVQQANQRPFRCAVIPFLGNSNAQGFIDTEQYLGMDDDKVYISFEGAVEVAKCIGWRGPREYKGLEDRVVELEAKIAQLEREVKEADSFADAAELRLTGRK